MRVRRELGAWSAGPVLQPFPSPPLRVSTGDTTYCKLCAPRSLGKPRRGGGAAGRGGAGRGRRRPGTAAASDLLPARRPAGFPEVPAGSPAPARGPPSPFLTSSPPSPCPAGLQSPELQEGAHNHRRLQPENHLLRPQTCICLGEPDCCPPASPPNPPSPRPENQRCQLLPSSAASFFPPHPHFHCSVRSDPRWGSHALARARPGASGKQGHGRAVYTEVPGSPPLPSHSWKLRTQ